MVTDATSATLKEGRGMSTKAGHRWKKKFHLRFDPYEIPPGVEHFVGREDELAALDSGLTGSTKSPRSVFIHGSGGMGKTQLTIAFLKKFHQNYSAVIWFNARNESTLLQSFDKVARRLGYCSADEVGTMSMVEDVKTWLGKNKNWLLVLDNYNGPKEAIPCPHGWPDEPTLEATYNRNKRTKPFDIRKYLPRAQHGAMIITTRSTDVPGGHLCLGKLDGKSAQLQISSRLSQNPKFEEDPGISVLATKLNGHPLALATAGALLLRENMSCREYLEELDTVQKELKEARLNLLTDGDHITYATWSVSYRKFTVSKDQHAADLLRLWAYFAKEDIFFELLLAAFETREMETRMTRLEFDEAMHVLTLCGFVERAPAHRGYGSTGYSIHENAHSWVFDVLIDRDKSVIAEQQALECIALNVLAPSEAHQLNRRLLHHAEEYSIERIKYIQLFTIPQYRLGRLCRFLHTVSCIMVLSRMWDDKEHLDELNSISTSCFEALKGAGLCESRNGILPPRTWLSSFDSKKDEWCQKDCCEGSHLPRSLEAMRSFVGNVYKMQGRLEQAQRMYHEIREKYQFRRYLAYPKALNAFTSIARVHSGDLEESAKFFHKALQEYDEHMYPLGPVYIKDLSEAIAQRDMTGQLLNITRAELGDLYHHHGKLSEARQVYQAALRGPVGPDQGLRIVYSLGKVFLDESNFEEAGKSLQRALKGYESVHRAEHPDVLQVVDSLGQLYLAQAQLDQAETMFRRALSGYDARFGFVHAATLESATLLAHVLKSRQKDDDAKGMYHRAHTGYVQLWSGDSSNWPEWAVDGCFKYGDLLREENDLISARELYQAVLPGVARHYGVDNRRHVQILKWLEKSMVERVEEGLQSAKARIIGLVEGSSRAAEVTKH